MDDSMKQKILSLLDAHRIMTIATLRPDGWPQATTVGYVNEGLTLWFLCGLESQKANNLARDNRVSWSIVIDTRLSRARFFAFWLSSPQRNQSMRPSFT